MSNQISRAFIDQFRANFDMLSQQMNARLLPAVIIDQLAAETGYRDQIGAVEAVQRTSRHADTPLTEIPHARRAWTALDWEMAEIIDLQDTERMLTNPQSTYTQAFAASFNRRRDQTILDAFFAPARTGRFGETTVNFPAGQQVAVDYVETGTATNSSLTIAKLRRARELLMDAEVADDGDSGFFIACSQRELNSLLRTVEVTSSDYNSVKALVDGQVNSFMGFNFIRVPSARLPVAGGNRRIPAWHRSGMLFAQLMDTMIDAAKDPTKGFNTRLYGRASFGATRLEEVKVVELTCHPTTF